MVGKRKDAPTLPGAQPAGSGATPGSAQGAEELSNTADQPPYTGPGAYAGGEQVAPGVNDGTAPELADTEADAELAEAADEPMVEYTGPFPRREITNEQWAAAGVKDMPTVIWDRQNSKRVPANVFSPQALQVLRQDQGFRVP